jgi:hypothetical protein
VAVTVAFATTPPDASVILPVNTRVPAVCAIRDGANATNRQITTTPGRQLCNLRKIVLHICLLTLSDDTMTSCRDKALQKYDMSETLPRLFWQMTVCSSMDRFFQEDDNLFIDALFSQFPSELGL